MSRAEERLRQTVKLLGGHHPKAQTGAKSPMSKEPRENRVPVMMSADELSAIDDWRFANQVATRSGAIRRLCQIGLPIAKRPAEVAASPGDGSNNPRQENAVNEQHPSTASAVPTSEIDRLKALGDRDAVLNNIQALADAAASILGDSAYRKDVSEPFRIPRRDYDFLFAVLAAIDLSCASVLGERR